ncbi:MAG: DUF2946 domain-containing protein [Caulobacter sp.]|nr:DUF2946 domain-containing protein [Caulobacter sp.]
MHGRRKLRRNGLAGALPALLAVFAMLLQGLIPASALAQEAWSSGKVQTVVLCTASGEQTVAIPADPSTPQQGFAGFKCHACVMASLLAITPPAPALSPVRYSQIIRAERSRVEDHPAFVRRPPRPPSQGPPTVFDL